MIEIDIQKNTDTGDSGKNFHLEKGKIEILHDTTDGNDVVRVIIDGVIEFKYDVNNPEKEIIGHFTPWEDLTKGLTKTKIDNLY